MTLLYPLKIQDLLRRTVRALSRRAEPGQRRRRPASPSPGAPAGYLTGLQVERKVLCERRPLCGFTQPKQPSMLETVLGKQFLPCALQTV